MITYYCDAWTSGNPGKGGWRYLDDKNNTIFSKDYTSINTNNFYELKAVQHAVFTAIFIDEEDCIIYTDSKVVLSWLKNGSVSKSFLLRNPVYGLKLNSIIQNINDILKISTHSAQFLFIDGGSNPADYNRRKH